MTSSVPPSREEGAPRQIIRRSSSLSSNLLAKLMLAEEGECDLVFVCSGHGQRVQAHQVMLAAASSFLRTLFESLATSKVKLSGKGLTIDIVKNPEIVIHLPDAVADDVKILLGMIYSPTKPVKSDDWRKVQWLVNVLKIHVAVERTGEEAVATQESRLCAVKCLGCLRTFANESEMDDHYDDCNTFTESMSNTQVIADKTESCINTEDVTVPQEQEEVQKQQKSSKSGKKTSRKDDSMQLSHICKCGASKQTSRELDDHILGAHFSKTFRTVDLKSKKCPQPDCDATLSSGTKLRRHLFCAHNFVSRPQLQQWIKIPRSPQQQIRNREEDRLSRCDYCSKAVPSDQLRFHVVNEHLRDLDIWTGHVRVTQGEHKQQRYVCIHCSRAADSEVKVKHHVYKHHSDMLPNSVQPNVLSDTEPPAAPAVSAEANTDRTEETTVVAPTVLEEDRSVAEENNPTAVSSEAVLINTAILNEEEVSYVVTTPAPIIRTLHDYDLAVPSTSTTLPVQPAEVRPRNQQLTKRSMEVDDDEVVEVPVRHFGKRAKRDPLLLICQQKFKLEDDGHQSEEIPSEGVGIGVLNDSPKQHTKRIQIRCPLCEEIFGMANSLIVHLAKHKKDQHEEFHCGVNGCDYKVSLSRLPYYKRHILSKHTFEMSYQCGYCGKQMNSDASLALHVKNHKCADKHYCVKCDRFIRDEKLAAHNGRCVGNEVMEPFGSLLPLPSSLAPAVEVTVVGQKKAGGVTPSTRPLAVPTSRVVNIAPGNMAILKSTIAKIATSTSSDGLPKQPVISNGQPARAPSKFLSSTGAPSSEVIRRVNDAVISTNPLTATFPSTSTRPPATTPTNRPSTSGNCGKTTPFRLSMASSAGLRPLLPRPTPTPGTIAFTVSAASLLSVENTVPCSYNHCKLKFKTVHARNSHEQQTHK